MTKQEKLAQVLADGAWHSTAELVEQVGHRFSAALHRAVGEGAGLAGGEATGGCAIVCVSLGEVERVASGQIKYEWM